MAIEIKKPTTFTEGALLLWTNEANCYDVQGTGGDETTFGYQTLDTDESPSIRFHAWQAKVETYTATVLKLKWKTSIQTGDDEFGIEYTKNGGGAWADLVTKGVNRSVAYTTAEIALDANQDLTQVEVRVNSDKVKGADGCDLQISDIWTEGTYTPGNIIVSPTPVSAVATALIGAILLGSTAVTPTPASAIGERANPVIVHGSLSITPSSAESVATTVNPTVILGSSLVTPSPASAVASIVDPSVIMSSMIVTPSPAESIAGIVDPTVIKGSLLLSPSPVEAIGAIVDPTVIEGEEGVTVSPDPASAVAGIVNPTVLLGSSSVIPSPASAVASLVDPTIIFGSLTIIPSPASVVATTIDPTVVKGSLTIVPTPANSVGATVDPTIIKGSLALSPSPASSVGAVVDPTAILGNIAVIPSPASAIGAVVDPTVIITTPVPPKLITGVMSENLHIKGIMSKEFSAIRCLDFNGSTDYVEVPDDNSLDITDAITIEIWGKRDSFGSWQRILSKGSDGIPKSRYGLFFDSNNFLRFNFYSSGVLKNIFYGTITDTNRHHIVVTYNQSFVIFYIDVIPSSHERTGVIDSTVGNSLKIGVYLSGTMQFFNGIIDEVRIYNRALNSTEVESNFNGKITQDGLVAEWLMREQKGNILHDTSVNSNHGTIHGADWYEKKFNTPLKGIMSNSSEITGIMTAEYI